MVKWHESLIKNFNTYKKHNDSSIYADGIDSRLSLALSIFYNIKKDRTSIQRLYYDAKYIEYNVYALIVLYEIDKNEYNNIKLLFLNEQIG